MSISMIARMRDKARQCRRIAFRMDASFERTVMERLAARWDVIATAEANNPLKAANEA